MFKMEITRVDYNNGNTPILSKHEIEEFAYNVLADYKSELLEEPGAVRYEHFLEKYLGLELVFRDIYYEKSEKPILGITVFDKCVVKVFDKENETVKNELMRADSIIIDNVVTKPGREGFANFTGIHEGGHYLIHSGVSFPTKTRKIFCRRASIDGSVNTLNWLEYQANYFAAALTMPNRTFKPFVHQFLREQGVYKNQIALGADDDLDILVKDLLPEYISEVYCVSKLAAFNKLKSSAFIYQAQI